MYFQSYQIYKSSFLLQYSGEMLTLQTVTLGIRSSLSQTLHWSGVVCQTLYLCFCCTVFIIGTSAVLRCPLIQFFLHFVENLPTVAWSAPCFLVHCNSFLPFILCEKRYILMVPYKFADSERVIYRLEYAKPSLLSVSMLRVHRIINRPLVLFITEGLYQKHK